MTEPRISTRMVSIQLVAAIDSGAYDIETIAARADVSTRTVYRVIKVWKPTVSLETGDALLVAIGSHLHPTMLVWEDASRFAA